MGFQLKNKVVIITGAAQGLGKHLAELSILESAKGVIITDINKELLLITEESLKQKYDANSRIISFQHNIQDPKQWDHVWEESEKKFGHVDVLVNNAGITSFTEWENCINTNLMGTLHGGFLAIKKMAKGGRIVNIASMAGLIIGLGDADESGYTISKQGVVAFTKSFAKKSLLKKLPGTKNNNLSDFHGIKCYAICPFFIDTNMLKSVSLQNKLEKVLTVEEVGKAFLLSLEIDQNGACYTLYPGSPIIEFPSTNAFAYNLMFMAGVLLKKVYPDLQILQFSTFFALIAVVVTLILFLLYSIC
ncbi:15-hydroxyprostaglandin dehydrogenase [NAD(+)] [Lepeophtheirus salmonis]|uniref:15-hydroxyprostaglandin dehydrogenase [NAD(+)] n=1 Tax=Lepeophtheirus salmonis TaxID=72036 RepID=UPI001AE718DA|nr:15-hydroxyprostaglandin dehydrogenase [NAD(+)]-like [Lepeophtheirus salmonis]